MAKVATTQQLLAIDSKLQGGKRVKIPPRMKEVIEESGVHLLDDVMMHEDAVRCILFMKVDGREEAYQVYPYDVPVKKFNELESFEAWEQRKSKEGITSVGMKKITRKSFMEWLDNKDVDEFVGSPGRVSFCPIACFYKEHGAEYVYVTSPSIDFGENFDDERSHVLPGWALEFIRVVDKTHYTKITASRAKRILEEV